MHVSSEFSASVVEVVGQLITPSQKTHNMNYKVNSTRCAPLSQIFLGKQMAHPGRNI